MTKLRMTAIVSIPMAIAIALAGCATTAGGASGMPGMDHGGGSSSSPATTVQGEFNAADSMFAMMMIPHHEQAIEMSDVILAKTGVDQDVLDLAQQIKDAQAPEIELMQSWLDDWGMPTSGGMDGMDHGNGMMSGDDMAALAAAEGDDAARLFLQQMIEHHQGAIDMAQDVLDDGANPEVLALAERIISAQTDEIATMEQLLADL
jgi:uncharacterized protein (DUF305 family)